jgi:hemerythrin
VDYLGAYADIHFKGEEKCMESYQCPAHAENQLAHEQFREFIRNYKTQCELKGFNLDQLRNLHDTMQTWIREHILKIDTRLRPCIHPAPSTQNGSGTAPAPQPEIST